MADAEPPKRWRQTVGTMHCIAGGILGHLALILAAGVFAAIVGGAKLDTIRYLLLATVFVTTVGSLHFWIGHGDRQSQQRASWLVRSLLWFCFALLIAAGVVLVLDS
jgi:hypothetical protein